MLMKLLQRKEQWALTVRGWIVVAIFSLGVLFLLFRNLNSLLSPKQPVSSDVLVVEGWLPDYALDEVMRIFRQHHYRLIITTGGALEQGFYLETYKTEAQLMAASLVERGVGKDSIISVPAGFVVKDRTYAAAIALKQWLHDSSVAIHSFNIISLGAHARRTRLLFQKAFGGEYSVGIISAHDLSYDPRVWWRSSDGVRKVVDETIAYLYARFLFFPHKQR